MEFAWDPDKAARNLSKHGVPFTEAGTVFDPLAVTYDDPDHSAQEDRFVTLVSRIEAACCLSPMPTETNKHGLSAPELATRGERKLYEETE